MFLFYYRRQLEEARWDIMPLGTEPGGEGGRFWNTCLTPSTSSTLLSQQLAGLVFTSPGVGQCKITKAMGLYGPAILAVNLILLVSGTVLWKHIGYKAFVIRRWALALFLLILRQKNPPVQESLYCCSPSPPLNSPILHSKLRTQIISQIIFW